MRKPTDKEMLLTYQLFIGKVTDELGVEKTMQLLKEAREAIINSAQ